MKQSLIIGLLAAPCSAYHLNDVADLQLGLARHHHEMSQEERDTMVSEYDDQPEQKFGDWANL